MRGGRRDLELAIRLFENKTGRTNYTMDDVAKWIEENKVMPMPEPPTSRQILARQLSKAAGAVHRTDADSDVTYRAYHSIRVERNGEISYDWFDADGPACTEQSLQDATRRRRDQALGIGVGVKSDWKHFLRTHPDAEASMPDFDLNWEIDIRLGEQDQGEEENRKAG